MKSSVLLMCLMLFFSGKAQGNTIEVKLNVSKVHPEKDDSYICTSMVLSSEDYYIVKYEPNAHKEIVHHMLLFGCDEPASDKKSWDCGDMGAGTCVGSESLLFGWAKDAPSLQLPKGVGFKVGGGTKIKYFVLQLHYVKPLEDGQYDSSGLTLHMTSIRQPNIASIYLILANSAEIPPDSKGIHVDVACKYDSDQEIHPFAFRTHSHDLGRVITGYRVRNNTWKLLGKGDPHAAQAFYPMKNGTTIKKGDILAARCTYDTYNSNKTEVTRIGATAKDEMCNFYMMYYRDARSKSETPELCRDQDTYKDLFSSFPKDSDVALKSSSTSHHHHHHHTQHTDNVLQHATKESGTSNAPREQEPGTSSSLVTKGNTEPNPEFKKTTTSGDVTSDDVLQNVSIPNDVTKLAGDVTMEKSHLRKTDSKLFGQDISASSMEDPRDHPSADVTHDVTTDVSTSTSVSEQTTSVNKFTVEPTSGNKEKEESGKRFNVATKEPTVQRRHTTGTQAAGTQTAGTQTTGTQTAGTQTAGTQTAGTQTARTQTAGTQTTETRFQPSSPANEPRDKVEFNNIPNHGLHPTSSPNMSENNEVAKKNEMAKVSVVDNWWLTKGKLGQVTGLGVDSAGLVIVFHRGSRIWDIDTFNDNNIFLHPKSRGTIHESTILILDAKSGRLVEEWGQNMFYLPHGLTVDHEDNIWVTDVGRHQVMKLTRKPSLKPSLTLGEELVPGSDDKHFCKPTDIAVERSGVFYVADGYCNGRIMKFSPKGFLLKKWGETSFNPGLHARPSTFTIPHSLTLDKKRGMLYVADRENGRIQCFDTQGKFHKQISSPMFGGRVFAVDYNDQGDVLYALNGPGNTKVQGFTIQPSTGKVLSTWSPHDKGFSQPHAVVSSGPEIYVGEIGPNLVWKMETKHAGDAKENNYARRINNAVLNKPTIEDKNSDNHSQNDDKQSNRPAIVILTILGVPAIILLFVGIVSKVRGRKKLHKYDMMDEGLGNPSTPRDWCVSMNCCRRPYNNSMEELYLMDSDSDLEIFPDVQVNKK